MSRLAARRASLCLFCSLSALVRPQPRRLLARIQTATRTTEAGPKPPRVLGQYNPLKSDRKGRPRDSPKDASRPQSVGGAMRTKMGKLKDELGAPEFLEPTNITRDDFVKEWQSFEKTVAALEKTPSKEMQKLMADALRGKKTLETRLRYMFYAQLFGERFTKAELDNQKEVADLRYPSEWYPATRQIPRVVHLHVGPTNSGKTYHALKRLEEADTGIYLGPLRLLAHEVYTRMNAKGRTCALVTGEEQRIPELDTGDRPNMFSCTVEMTPLNVVFDVAVIDEIQMINHPERGWAWTQAFLGLMAKEIHLCGEARTVPIIKEICALVGDQVHVHEYTRLTPLAVQPQSLAGNLEKLEKGDCIVAFTILGIHALRREVEKKTGKKCAIVYGSLPPETRAQQARLFNDPDNDYDYLVASDAIGMGLNLAIKRVIFESTIKSNGVQYLPLAISDLKQIAGRAGRYKTAHEAVISAQDSIADSAIDPAIGLDDKLDSKKDDKKKTVGWVTTLDRIDHEYLKKGMAREPEPIETAGLFPPSIVVERFANYFPPGTPFSYIMLRLHEISNIHPRFHLCALKDQLAIADAIHTIQGLSVVDRIAICAAPINVREVTEKAFLRAMASCIADGKSGAILDMKELPLDIMDIPATGDRAYLYKLESLHKMIVCYLWLSFRFPNVFTTRTVANYTKKLVEDQIEHTLRTFSVVEQEQMRLRARRGEAMKKMAQEEKDEQETAAIEVNATLVESQYQEKPVIGQAEETLREEVERKASIRA